MPTRTESRRTQLWKLRTEHQPTPAEARWIAEHRPRTRAECPTTRPCHWLSCKYNNGVDVMEFGVLAFVEGLPPEDSCALDVAERVEGVGLDMEQIGAIRGRSRQWANLFVAYALIHLRTLVADDRLSAKVLRANSRRCVLCEIRGVGWLPLCMTHAIRFANSVQGRTVLTNKAPIVEALAKFVGKTRGSGPAARTVEFDEEELADESSEDALDMADDGDFEASDEPDDDGF